MTTTTPSTEAASPSVPSVAVSRDIPAAAGAVFAVLTDPANHADFDGSGMLRGPFEERDRLSAVGDVFAVRMCHPRFGRYVMNNRVIEFEVDRRLVWAPTPRPEPGAEPDRDADGRYLWGWELEALDAGHTRVTEWFDCRRSPEWLREATDEGQGWRSSIEQSLVNIEDLVARSS